MRCLHIGSRGISLKDMHRILARKLLAIALALTLAFGQGAVLPSMAASMAKAARSTDQAEIPLIEHSVAGAEACCPMCDQDQHPDHGLKGGSCAAFCSAISQAALPLQPVAFVRHPARLTYEITDSEACGRALVPEYPPPKA